VVPFARERWSGRIDPPGRISPSVARAVDSSIWDAGSGKITTWPPTRRKAVQLPKPATIPKVPDPIYQLSRPICRPFPIERGVVKSHVSFFVRRHAEAPNTGTSLDENL